MSDCRFGVSPVNYPDPDPETKLIPLIPKPHFWICIYLFLMDLFHLKFMISAMTLILI